MLITNIGRVLLDPGETETAASPSGSEATSVEGNAPADSSSASTEATAVEKAAPEKTLHEIAHEIFDASGPKPEEASDKESPVSNANETEEKEAEESAEASAPTEVEKGPVPYARFNEVNEKAKKADAELATLKPLAERAQQLDAFLNQTGIAPAEFKDALDTLALIRTNPREAYAKLKPLYEQLAQFSEDHLPPEVQTRIAKLQERVKEGEMSQAAADELRDAWTASAKAEKLSRNNEQVGKFTQQQQQQAYINSLSKAAGDWGNAKLASDPDYKPKVNGAPDGLFELTRKGFTYLLSVEQVKTPSDVTRLLESAYNDAKQLLGSRKTTATKPTPSSISSARNAPKEPSTSDEVVANIARKHGVAWTPRANRV